MEKTKEQLKEEIEKTKEIELSILQDEVIENYYDIY